MFFTILKCAEIYSNYLTGAKMSEKNRSFCKYVFSSTFTLYFALRSFSMPNNMFMITSSR